MADSFSVASFNALNLLENGIFFAGRRDADAYPEGVYKEKVDWIVRTLADSKADIVGFQELFSEAAFNDVTKKAEFPFSYAPDLAGKINMQPRGTGGVGTPPGIEARGPFVGLASKLPIVKQETVVDFPPGAESLRIQPLEGGPIVSLPFTRFQRPVIRAQIRLRDAKPADPAHNKPAVAEVIATVFVCHLKSKRIQTLQGEDDKDPLVVAAGSARSLMIRAAEAIALRKLIVDATQGTTTPVILFGDLNDDLGSVTTQIIAGEEPYRFDPKAEKTAEWDRLLYSVHDIEEAESYRDVSYTHIYNGRYELLDHIFVSQELYHRNPEHIAKVGLTRIFNDHLLDERRAVNPGRGPSARSDHGIPVTEIAWR